jgi:2-keto-4-pentenoate hydratase/2-oxohepta-3-ene-1,7-dioic acid hydratase in catechol pathway
MRLLRVGDVGRERPCVLDPDGGMRDVSAITQDFDGAFFASGGMELLRAADLASLPIIEPGQRIGAPVARPWNVWCIGLNYVDHAAESKMEVPSEPIVFTKSSRCIVGPYDDVLQPRGSTKMDYEAELAVVIGKECRYLESDDEARAAIAGYAVANDVSERAFQMGPGGQWTKGKTPETFNPLGPWLVTPDDPAVQGDLEVTLDVNGERRQTGMTSWMVFDVPTIIRYLSRYAVLEAGDVINTGTPPGVAMGMAVPGWIGAGDEMRVSVTGLGEQRSRIVSA